jgi:AsmA protein
MRTVKIVAVLVGGIVALFVAALLAAWLLVNPNDYKGRIAAAVREATGRDLIVSGDIQLSLFPWVALGLGPASLENPPGFGTEPFLAFRHAALRVRLWALLAKRLDVDRVELDGLELRLAKNAQGVGNWQNFGHSAPHAVGATGATGATGVAGAGAGATVVGAARPGPLRGLAGIAVTNGSVSYQGMVVENLNLQTGAFGGSRVTPVSMTFDVKRGVPGESVTVNAKFDLSGDGARKRLRLEAVNFNGLLSRAGDGRPAHWELHAPSVEVDLAAQTAAVPGFDGGYSSAHVSGRLEAVNIIDDLSVTGAVSLAPVVLRELAPRLGFVLPRTRDPRAFAQLAGSGDFSYGSAGVRLEKLQATLDDTHLKGSLAVAGEPPVLKFALTADQLDVSRYLPSEEGASTLSRAEASSTPRTKTATLPGAKTSTLPRTDASSTKFPAAEGTVTVALLHFAPLEFSNVRLTLTSKAAVTHLFPALATLDGGSYSGNITVDAGGAVPAYTMDEHLSGVDLAQLLGGTGYQGRLTGRGNLNLKATARGAGMDAVLRTLSGRVDANVANGALQGVDLDSVIGRAEALLDHGSRPGPGPALGSRPESGSGSGPAGSRPPRTRFDAFEMSAQISDGIARTADLVISSPMLRVTGQGSVNLVTRGIDFQLLASVLQAPGASVADIPVRVAGTYSDPTFKPDVGAMVKGALKDKIQDVLKKNGLQGLFGK